jgi:hypothetical protein
VRCVRHFYSLFVFLHSSIWVSYNRSVRISKKNYVAVILTILVVMPVGMFAQNTAVDFEENGELQQRLDYLRQRLGILPPPSGARAFALQQMNLVSTFDAASGSTVSGIRRQYKTAEQTCRCGSAHRRSLKLFALFEGTDCRRRSV